MGIRAAIVGASGYAGGELVRLIDRHPDLELAFIGAHTRAGEPLAAVHPHLSGGERVLDESAEIRKAEIDIAFLALPHGASAELGHDLTRAGVRVVDLGSDYRLDTSERYEEAYGSAHPFPDDLAAWAYGLPELFRADIVDAAAVAVPGCYPTASLLALAPLLTAGVIAPDRIVVDALSGVSGAGRGTKANLMYGAVSEGAAAYGLLTHRHRPEIEQGLEHASGSRASVTFTPHLVPMQRGLLATCYADAVGDSDPAAVLQESYDGPFVAVIDEPPQTRWVVGSNRCLLAAWHDVRTDRVIVTSAIDNLMKGAAGQAIQVANLMMGLDEATGLPLDGWMP